MNRVRVASAVLSSVVLPTPDGPRMTPLEPRFSARRCSAVMKGKLMSDLPAKDFGDLVRVERTPGARQVVQAAQGMQLAGDLRRSEEHTSELQSIMRNPYAVLCF